LCCLISQLSLISLLSIEMLSDCVISGLYMRVLKLTWKNLISVNFPQFSVVSVWSVRMVSIGVQTDKSQDGTLLESGREWSPIVRTRLACVRMRAATTGWTVSKTVRTRATCLLVPNAARVWTKLLHRSDGDPTEAIYTLESPFSPIPHIIYSLAFCE